MIFLVVADHGYDGTEVYAAHRDLAVAQMHAESLIGELGRRDQNLVVPWRVVEQPGHPFGELDGPAWRSTGVRDYPNTEFVVVAVALRG